MSEQPTTAADGMYHLTSPEYAAAMRRAYKDGQASVRAEARPQDGSALRSALERLVNAIQATDWDHGSEGAEIARALIQARVAAIAALPPSAPPALDVERLQRIQDLQPNAVAYLRGNGFVMDVTGPLGEDASELDRWKVLAFSLYTDIVEASTIAEHMLAAEYARLKVDR